ncbi:hypothetical protein D9619_008655 [Psilocybe cf. subviscida]|uniref:F-box domain-containing protein n=1 Tax=Psilocybe cf. subviscida TaxID=2480587 RepID=A0A8H5B9X9_9AGAR|nr:hypothetical protein D9619_008655 [Psilocybe cf. subviscida]
MHDVNWISYPGYVEVDTDSGDPSSKMPLSGLMKAFRRTTTSKSSCGLPDELIEQIFLHCSRRDLFSVGSTCWRLFQITKGIIYRHVDPVNNNRAIDLFLTICLRKELGPMVRQCELSLAFKEKAPSSPLAEPYFDRRVQRVGARAKFTHREILRDLGALAAAALAYMQNLTHLELFFPNKEVQVDYVTRLQLQRCPFQLETFHTNLRFDMAMLAFLQRQKALKDLMFYTSAPLSALDMAAITPDCMPALSSLGWSNQVPMDLVLALVSHRPIHTVNVHFSSLVSDVSEFLDVGPAADHIRTGNFTFRNDHHPDCSQLEAIYDHLPHLTGLGIAVVILSPVSVIYSFLFSSADLYHCRTFSEI